jgi:GAF domain-containing protein
MAEQGNSINSNTRSFESKLLELSRQLLSSLNLYELILSLNKLSLEIFEADDISLLQLEKGVSLTVNDNYPDGIIEVVEIPPPLLEGKSLAGKTLINRQINATSDFLNDPSFEHHPDNDRLAHQNKLVAVLSIPIIVGNEVTALIAIGKREKYNWTNADFSKAEQIASFAALAINNARLFETSSILSERQALLLEICQKVLFTLDLSEVLNSLSENVQDLLGVDHVTISLIDKGQLLVDIQNTNYKFKYTTLIPAYLRGKGVGGLAYQTGQIVVTPDYFNDPRFLRDPDIDEEVRSYGIVASMAVPIYLKDNVVALMWASHKKPYHWTKQDIEMAGEFSSLVSLAIHNARLYQDLEQLNETLAQRNKKLEEMVVLQREQERLKAVLSLARTAAHELSQPLTLLQAEIELITEFGQTPDKETYENMRSAINEITERLKQYQRIVRVEYVEPAPGISVLDRQLSFNEIEPGYKE